MHVDHLLYKFETNSKDLIQIVNLPICVYPADGNNFFSLFTEIKSTN